MEDRHYDELLPGPHLTDKQRKLVDEYFVDLNKGKAFVRAGYTCSRPDKIRLRVNQAFKARAVQEEIERRRRQNTEACRAISPLDAMLENLAHFHELANRPGLDPAEARAARLLMEACARDAAPYLHPRLATIAHFHHVKKSVDDFSDEELQLLATSAPQVEQSSEDAGDVSTEPTAN